MGGFESFIGELRGWPPKPRLAPASPITAPKEAKRSVGLQMCEIYIKRYYIIYRWNYYEVLSSQQIIVFTQNFL